MVNNEFNLIGICTSNYQYIGNGKWKSYLLRIEIEKFSSKQGNSFEIEVQIYANNKVVDTSMEMLGRQVAINGYVDSYETNEGKIVVKLIAQRVYPLGDQKATFSEEVETNPDVETSEFPRAEDFDDDDMPF